MEFPIFKYFNEPVNSNSFAEYDGKCSCCGKKSGWRYVGPYRCTKIIEGLCAKCIANGDAYNKYCITFNKVGIDQKTRLDDDVIDELEHRTPSYRAHRNKPQETRIFNWLTHCNDACVYHGYASFADLESVKVEDRAGIFNKENIHNEYWNWVLTQVRQGYLSDFYSEFQKFRCLHCDKELFYCRVALDPIDIKSIEDLSFIDGSHERDFEELEEIRSMAELQLLESEHYDLDEEDCDLILKAISIIESKINMLKD